MIYCKKCVYPTNHPLNIILNSKGVCSGCIVHDEKNTLNWNQREKKLFNLISPYKKSQRNIYNCIVPLSGGKDSYFILDYVKNVLKLRPLVVTYNKHYNTLTGHRNLSNLKSKLGFSSLNLTVNPNKIKKITKVTLRKMGSIYWHCIAGQTVFPVQIACKFKIPLIIWGAHQGVDQVGMFSHTDEVEMTRKYRKEHDLMGYEAEDLLSTSRLMESDLENFFYPSDQDIENVGVRGIYLNNYIRWDSLAQHNKMVKKYKYETLKQLRTFDHYNDVDCVHYSGLHDYIKFLKYGYSKIHDHCSREIRLKRMTRNQAIKLVKKYTYTKPKDIDTFLKWLEISETYFYKCINNFRDPNIWYFNNGHWKLKDTVCLKNKNLIKEKDFNLNFYNNYKENNFNYLKKYELINRGWSET